MATRDLARKPAFGCIKPCNFSWDIFPYQVVNAGFPSINSSSTNWGIHLYPCLVLPRLDDVHLSWQNSVSTTSNMKFYHWFASSWHGTCLLNSVVFPFRDGASMYGLFTPPLGQIWPHGGFLKWWYPTTMGFPTKNDHVGVFWENHHLRKHPHKPWRKS